MNKIVLLVLVVGLAACDRKEAEPYYGYTAQQAAFEPICLEDWHSPRFNFPPTIKIDAKTLQPSRCE